MSVRAEVIRCDSRGSLRCGFSSTSGIWARPGPRGGFGKSVLLDAAGERAVREGFAVLGARGHASEADLAWSAATEALGDLVAGGHAAALPAVQQEALDAALAGGPAPGPIEPGAVLGVAETAVGGTDGPAHLDLYHALLAEEGPRAGGFLAEVVAPSLAVFRPREADDLFVDLDAVLRDAAAAPALIALLAARAIATQTRRLPEAVGYAREAVELAETIGRPVLGRLPAVSLVLAAGLIGDRDACHAAAALLLDSGEPLLVQAALIGVGALHLSVGELDEAHATYERIGAEFGLGAGVTRWEPEWCEVLVRLGRLEEAAQALERAEATETAWLAEGPFHRVRGMLADDADASDRCFSSAVAWFQAVGNRMGEARTERRLARPSLRRAAASWVSTVRGDTKSAAAISRLVCPSAARRATSSSRTVSAAIPDTPAAAPAWTAANSWEDRSTQTPAPSTSNSSRARARCCRAAARRRPRRARSPQQSALAALAVDEPVLRPEG